MHVAEKDKLTRSPFFYVGDKFKLLPQLLPLFPSNFGRLIEPFLGGGSVALNAKSGVVLGNDINHHVISIHEMLLEKQDDMHNFIESLISKAKRYELSCSLAGLSVPIELKSKYPKTYFAQMNRKGFERLKSDYNNSSDRNTEDLYLLMIYGFNRMIRFNSRGEFNIPVGNVDFNSNVSNALLGYSAHTKNREITYTSQNFELFLDNLDTKIGDFVYLDPPYLITSSEYNKGWTESEEVTLYKKLDDLDNQGIPFALSNVVRYNTHTNDVLQKWMSKYDVVTIRSNYINYFDNGKKLIEEVLVRNYE